MNQPCISQTVSCPTFCYVSSRLALQRWDVLPHGVNSADEDMDGVGPGVATETCDVADFIHSQAWMLRVTGGRRYADRLYND